MTAPIDDDEGRSHLARRLSIALVIVMVAFIGVLATRDTADSRGTYSALVGRQVPPVAGETLDGEAYELPAAPGEWVIVNFFATWCIPCIREHPELVNFQRRHAGVGDASVVSVVYDTRPAKAREFFAENGGDWPVVLDPDGRIALDFGVSGVPESYVIAPDGTVAVKLVGGVTASQLDQIVADLQESS